jgi:hypothetical protein
MLEMSVGEAEIKTQKIQQWSYLASLDDTPESIAVGPRIKPEAIQESLEKLERSLSKGPEEHQEVRRLFILIETCVSVINIILHTEFLTITCIVDLDAMMKTVCRDCLGKSGNGDRRTGPSSKSRPLSPKHSTSTSQTPDRIQFCIDRLWTDH